MNLTFTWPLCSLHKVRRWGVFWRALEVRFDRRAPLISAAMRLHSYCIDRRIGTELRQVANASEIQPHHHPHMWAPTPNFGSQGGPIDFLGTSEHAPAASVSRCARRDELKRGIEGAGLVRPGGSARKLRCARGHGRRWPDRGRRGCLCIGRGQREAVVYSRAWPGRINHPALPGKTKPQRPAALSPRVFRLLTAPGCRCRSFRTSSS